ncbi:DUF748 domain-containing protein [Robertkochia aurantiaca]|uniref:DUF748 domain-containing protein n=1 Tax=Robertkochia aurantiaca TaxID=2873700 RepID=UPI001CCC42BB|nr:DUF748 domain-containing protein [Robertkochia sp. 3YJGBD-33]
MAIRKKTLRIIAISVLAILLLLIFLTPVIARNYIINNSKELVGRKLDMDKLRINFLTSTLKIYDFKMFEANESDIFVSFDTLIVNTEPYKLISDIISLDQFYLRGLQVNISKRDTVFNFDDLVAYHASADSVETDTTGKVFKYRLAKLELKDANFIFYDGDVEDTTALEDMTFFIPLIEWNQDQDSNADIEFDLAEGGHFSSQVTMYPATGDFESTIAIEALELKPFMNYVKEFAKISDFSGKVNSELLLVGNTGNPQAIILSGEVVVNDFLMKDEQQEKFLGSDQLDIKLDKIDYVNKSYAIGVVDIKKPYINFELDSTSNNFFEVFMVADEESTQPADSIQKESSSKDSIYYAVMKLKVEEGILDYTDNLTGEPFEYHLSEILIDTDSIFSNSDWVDINSQMLLNERGTLKATTGFNPQDPLQLDLDFAIKDFVLSDLNIYASHYTGHSILKGDMFYFNSTEITDKQLIIENDLLIKNVSVENNEGGVMSIPLKLAVWILKDKNGDIELDVPVRGDLNDPKIDVWDLVGTTFKKKIFDATDNPVKSLARQIDAKPEDLEALLFEYPDTALTDRHKEQLDLILKLEELKGNIDIDMNFVFDTEMLTGKSPADSLSTIADSVMVASVPDGKEAEAPEEDIQQNDTTAIAAVIPELAEAENPDTLLVQYGRTIKGRISEYITQKKSDSKIAVKIAEISDPGNVGATPQFKVNYSMREEEEKAPAKGE